MSDIKTALQEFVATYNDPKVNKDLDKTLSYFPELKGFDKNTLSEYIATYEDPKVKGDWEKVNSYFPEFFADNNKTQKTTAPKTTAPEQNAGGFAIPMMFGNEKTIAPDPNTGIFTPEIAAGLRGEVNPNPQPAPEPTTKQWIGDLFEGMGGVASTLIGNTIDLGDRMKPENLASEYIARKTLGNKKGYEAAEKVRRLRSDKGDNKWIADQLIGTGKQLTDKSHDYYGTVTDENGQARPKDFTDLWSEGNYAGAFGNILLEGGKSLPTSVMAFNPVGLGVIGAGSFNEKYNDVSANKDVNMAQAVLNATGTASFELLSERLGALIDAKILKRIAKTAGAGKAKETAKAVIYEYLKAQPKEILTEGVEEAASQLAENITDIATGVKQPATMKDSFKMLFDNVLESGVYGMGGGAFGGATMGGTVAAGTMLTQPIKAKKQAESTFNDADRRLTDMLSRNGFTAEEVQDVKNSMLQANIENRNDVVLAISQAIPEAITRKDGKVVFNPEIGNVFTDFYIGSDKLQSVNKAYNETMEAERAETIRLEKENAAQELQRLAGPDGMIRTVKLKDGTTVQVRGESMVFDENGMFDMKNSSTMLYYTDEAEQPKMMKPYLIESLVKEKPIEQAAMEADQLIDQEISDKEIDEFLPLQPEVYQVEQGTIQVQYNPETMEIEAVLVDENSGTPISDPYAIDKTTYSKMSGKQMPEAIKTTENEPVNEGGAPVVSGDMTENAPVTSETAPVQPQYPVNKKGEVDFDAMTVAQTYQYMVDNYGQQEAVEALQLQEKNTQAAIQANIKATDKFKSGQNAEVKKATTIQEQLKIREKHKATAQKLTDERAVLDAQLAEIRALMPQVEQAPAQPEVKPVTSSNVRPEVQFRREQEANAQEQANLDSANETLTPNLDSSVIEVREKEKNKNIINPWQRRLNNLGDAMTVEDVVLRRIAGGAKFVWTANAPLKGMADELGFANKPGERELRKSIIDNENGMTPQAFAHVIYESGDLDFMPGVEYQDVYNAVLDTLLSVNSATDAMETAERLRDSREFSMNEQAEWDSMTEAEMQYLEEIPDDILESYLGITNFSPEQLDIIQNLQNEYYGTDTTTTEASAVDSTPGIESETTAAGTTEGIIKNGDTVTYKGKQYTVNGIYAGNKEVDLEDEKGNLIHEEVPVSELNQSEQPTEKQSSGNKLPEQAKRPSDEYGKDLFSHYNTNHGATNTVYYNDKTGKFIEVENTARGKETEITLEQAARLKFATEFRGATQRELNEKYNQIEKDKFEKQIADLSGVKNIVPEQAEQQPKQVDVAGVFNSLNKKGEAKLSENIIPDKVSAAQAEADAALQDFLDAFNDLNSDNLGIVDNTAEKQAKMLVAGTKMVGAYTKLGVYKFADLVSKLAEKGIQITEDLLSAIKKSYGAFAAENDIDELDDMKTVRSFTVNDLKQKNNDDLTPKTDNLPKNDVSLNDNKFFKEHVIFGTIPKTNDNGQPRSTEIIESEAAAIETASAAITNSASNVDSDKQRAGEVKEQATEQIKSVESLLAEVDNKLANLRLTDKSYSTEGVEADYPINVLAKGEIKKDLTKYIKAVAEITGLAHDTDKKGKTEIVNVNIAPAGGDATFFLWSKTNPEHGVYVSIPYDPDMNSGGWYDNYKVTNEGWRAQILWRVVNRAKKYDGSNRYMPTNVTAQEMAETLLKGINAELKSKGLTEEQVQEIKPAKSETKIKKSTQLPKNNNQSNLLSLFDEEKTPTQNDTERGNQETNSRLGNQEPQEPTGLQSTGVDSGSTTDNGTDGGRSSGISDIPATEGTRNTRNNVIPRGKEYAPSSPKARFDANIEAIKTVRRLIDSGKQATKADQQILRQYSGWGGLGTYFNNKYSPENKTLREVLTTEEYESAVMSINSAYYTPAAINNVLWDVAERLGFTGGNVLEGSAGIGNIIGSMPRSISNNANIEAVEIDEISGNILKYLYPDAKVHIKGFEETNIPNGSVDLAITNVPFVTGLHVYDPIDKDLSKKFKNIHDFCIAKNIRKLKEGGIGIFITSNGTLDKSRELREWIGTTGKADVIGAFRLNNDTFGGTNVTSDIIIVRKRVANQKHPKAIDVVKSSLVRSGEYDTKDTVWDKKARTYVAVKKQTTMEYNDYFKEHPEFMGGEMAFAYEKGDTFRPGGVGLYPGTVNQNKQLKQWLETFENIATEKIEPKKQEVSESTEAKEGQLILNAQGQLCLSYRGTAKVLDINSNKVKGETKAQCLKDYNTIKETLQAVLDYQVANESNDGLKPLLNAFNRAYDNFVAKYGQLNKNTTISFLRNDVDFPSIVSIEKYSETKSIDGKVTKNISKTSVFKNRVVSVKTELKPTNTKDAVIASIYKYGAINLPYIAESQNKTEQEIATEIINSKLGFKDPATGSVVVRHEYLSGDVRAKLKLAQASNDKSEYTNNIEELQKVIPMDIPAHLIEFTMGTSWLDKQLYVDYFKEKYNVDATVQHNEGRWIVVPSNKQNETNRSAGVYSEMLGITVYGSDLATAAMNLKPITLSAQRKDSFTGKTETITDKDATQAANTRVSEIRDDFKEFVRGKLTENKELADKMAQEYNDRANSYVPMEIDDTYLPERFEGSTEAISLHTHQKKATIRGTMEPLMLAHEVGAGKTFVLISTAMEMRRLGTANKPMIVVQNATVGQFVSSAKTLYPNAKILTITENDRTPEGRRMFYAKIKYSDWDMIVVPQSTFEMIPDSPEMQQRFIEEKIDEKLHALEALREENDDTNKWTILAMEKEIEALSAEQNALLSEVKSDNKEAKKTAKTISNAAAKAKEQLDRRTDDVQYFDQMGIDALLIDEAHEYKRLGFATSMTRGVKGIDPAGSKKSAGVYLKTRVVLEKSDWKNVVFATGTPISNTAAEIWTFMKYLIPKETLIENEIYYFDDFVRNFGSINQSLEFATNGSYKENTRFSSYINKPELIRLWATVTDTVLSKDIDAVNEKIPLIEGDKATDIFLPQTPSLIDIMRAVKARLKEFENMSGKEKRANSSIPIVMYGIAKRAAIDTRLVSKIANDEPNSKTNKAVEETLKSLKDSNKYKGTIAIFCDAQNRWDKDETGKKVKGFDLFEDIKAKLIAKGVAESEIMIIKPGMTVARKEKIFDAVNAGEIRVVLGNTKTLGTGVNMQERLHTLIHMDAPDRPMDYTQRNGRILRQGNLHKEWDIKVRILRFGVEDSLDVTSYQRLKTKAWFIDSIMDGKLALMDPTNPEGRILEEDEEGLFDNPVAVLSGSQYALLKNQAERELRKWESKKKQHEADQIYIQYQVKQNEQFIGWRTENLKGLEKAKAVIEAKFANGINVITIAGKAVKGVEDYVTDDKVRAKVNEAIKPIAKAINEKTEKARENAYFTKETVLTKLKFNEVEATITTEIERESQWDEKIRMNRIVMHKTNRLSIPELGVDSNLGGKSMMQAIETVYESINLSKINDYIKYAESDIEQYSSDNAAMEARRGKPFAHTEELKSAKAKVVELTELMKQELAAKEEKYKNAGSGNNIDISDVDSEEETESDDNILHEPTQTLLNFTPEETKDETNKAYGSEEKQQEAIDKTIAEAEKLQIKENAGLIANRRPEFNSPVLSKRTVLDSFKESGYVNFIGQRVNTHQDIADMWSIHRSPYIEKAHVIFVNDKNEIVGTIATTSNHASQARLTKPDEIIEHAQKVGATGIYMMHNHPSGNPLHSSQDVAITFGYKKYLSDAGIELKGHVIADHDKYTFIDTSKAELSHNWRDLRPGVTTYDMIVSKTVSQHEYKKPQPKLFTEREVVGNSYTAQERLFEIGKNLLSEPSYKSVVIYLSSNSDMQFTVAAYDIIPDEATKEDIVRIANEGLSNNLGSNAVIVHDGSYGDVRWMNLNNRILDVINAKNGSHFFTTVNESTEKYELWVRQVLGVYGARNLDAAEEATTRLDNLAVAKEMEATKTHAEIRLATGWERGVDGLWRYEVPDGELKENWEDAETLEQAWDNEELFTAYPQLREIRIGALSPDEAEMDGTYYSEGVDGMPTIYAGGNGIDGMKSTLIHEIQHAIQEIEGFAKGGNTYTIAANLEEMNNVIKESERLNYIWQNTTNKKDNKIAKENYENYLSKLTVEFWNKYNTLKKLSSKTLTRDPYYSFETYKRLSGETEARNVQERMNFTAEERRQTLLSATADVAPEDQIVLMDATGVSMSIPEKPQPPVFSGREDVLTRLKQSSEYAKKLQKWQKKNIENIAAQVGESEEVNKKLSELNKSVDKWSAKLWESWTDGQKPVKKWQDFLKANGVEINDANDYYMRFTMMPGRVEYRFTEFDKTYIEPFIETLKAFKDRGVDYDALGTYAKLKHADEYTEHVMNQKIAERGWSDNRLNLYTLQQTQPADVVKKYWHDWAEKRILNLKNDNAAEYEQAVKSINEQRDRAIEEVTPDFAGKRAIEERLGMSAEQYIADIESIGQANGLTDMFWKQVKRINEFSLMEEVRSGRRTAASAEQILSTFEWYVPLKNHYDMTAEETFDYSTERGQFFVTAVKRGKGRRSESGDPFSVMVSTVRSSIGASEENTLKQALHRLAELDPTGSTTVSKAWFKKTGEDADGKQIFEVAPTVEWSNDDTQETYNEKVRAFEMEMQELAAKGEAYRGKIPKLKIGVWIKPTNAGEHEVHVMRNGEMYVVRFNTSPRIPQAVNKVNYRYYEGFTGAIFENTAKLTRFMAATKTMFRPTFIFITNPLRDIHHGVNLAYINRGAKFTAQAVAFLPIAATTLMRRAAGKINVNNKYDMALNNYMLYGAKTGISKILELKQMERSLKSRMTNKPHLWSRFKNVYQAVSEVTENQMRFAVYLAALKNGDSTLKAVSMAKQATVNFDLKGNGRNGLREISSLYAFVRVGFQAIDGLYSASTQSAETKRRFAGAVTMNILGGMVLTGAISSLIYNLFKGDDDDEDGWINDFAKLSTYERNSNFLIWTPDGVAKYPLGQEFRVFHGLGMDMLMLMHGKATATETAINFGAGITSLLPYNPIESAVMGSWGSAMPDAVSPWTELAANRDWMGARIYKENQDEDAPGYMKVRTNKRGEYYASEFMYRLSKALDKATGGDEAVKGWFSPNPDVSEHLVGGYLNGLLAQTLTVADGIINKDPKEFIPSAVWKSSDDIRQRTGGLNEVYYDVKKATEKIKNRADRYEEAKDELKQELEKGLVDPETYNSSIRRIDNSLNALDKSEYYTHKGVLSTISELEAQLKANKGDKPAQQRIETSINELKEYLAGGDTLKGYYGTRARYVAKREAADDYRKWLKKQAEQNIQVDPDEARYTDVIMIFEGPKGKKSFNSILEDIDKELEKNPDNEELKQQAIEIMNTIINP